MARTGRTRVELDGVPDLMPVDGSMLHERAYEQLRQMLMAGDLRPGEVVTIKALADTLGTSLMPIRDAVRQLLAIGALETTAGRAIRVPELTLSRFEELWSLRCQLEGEASARAAERITGAEIADLETMDAELGRLAEAESFEQLFAANHRFFAGVYRVSRSPLLVSFVETLWVLSGPHYNGLRGPDIREIFAWVRASLDDHEDLIAALKARDGDAARRARQKILLDLADVLRPRMNFSGRP